MNNFKVKCVSCVSGYYGYAFTEGKEYEVKDGKLIDDEGAVLGNYCSVDEINEDFLSIFEFVKEIIIPKDLLKPCMVVELQDRRLCLIANTAHGLALLISFNTYIDIADYDENLVYKDTDFSDFNINKIYGYSSTYIEANKLKTSNRELIWVRKEKPKVTKITIEEIKQLLNIDGELEIVKEQDSSHLAVRCISSADWFFKEGNTYEIKNGILVDECGCSWIIDTSLECLHKKINARFEIVN